MKTRTMLELRILGEKKYLFIILILWIMSRSAVIAVIFILLRVNLLSDYSDFVNFLCKMGWLICSIWIWNKLSTRRELFLEGKLDWVFGDNLPDDPMLKKSYCKNENCNNEITKNRYNLLWTDNVCDDCKDQSD